MLSGQIISSDTTLNNFKTLDTKNFIPGAGFTMFFRILNPEKDDLRFIPPATTKITLTLNKNDATVLTKTSADVINPITVLADDRSIVKVIITNAEAVDLLGGNFKFELDLLNDGTQLEKGIVRLGLSKIIDGDC